jgi:hypothetical protein
MMRVGAVVKSAHEQRKTRTTTRAGAPPAVRRDGSIIASLAALLGQLIDTAAESFVATP